MKISTFFQTSSILMTTMMGGFVEHVINNPQTCYRSAKQVGLQNVEKRRASSTVFSSWVPSSPWAMSHVSGVEFMMNTLVKQLV